MIFALGALACNRYGAGTEHHPKRDGRVLCGNPQSPSGRIVHLHGLLHLDSSSENRWNVAALILAVLIMLLFVRGSIWIMYSLHYRMM